MSCRIVVSSSLFPSDPQETKRPGALASRASGSERLEPLGRHGDEHDATASAGSPPGLGTTAGRGPPRHEFVDAPDCDAVSSGASTWSRVTSHRALGPDRRADEY